MNNYMDQKRKIFVITSYSIHYTKLYEGYGNSGLVSLVSFPEEWKPLQVEPAANLVGGKLLFNHKFDRDMKMGVEISR